MSRRRVAELSPGQVEAHHATILVRHGQMRELQRQRGVVVAQAADDHAGGDVGLTLCPGDAAQRRIDCLLERQSLQRVEWRCIPHLDVAHTFGGDIDREFVRHPFQRVLGLHHRQRRIEAHEVVLERPGVVHAHELTQRIGIVARQRHAILARQLDHRLRTHRAIEMAVQLGLRQPAQQRAIGGHERRAHVAASLAPPRFVITR